jgi:hypothetical protein
MVEPTWGYVFMDIIKTTIPALIVFFTVYYIGKQFYKNQETQKLIDDRSEHRDKTMNIKLLAFERLVLFCDRIDVVNLALRLSGKDQTAKSMMQGMLISIQKEYEHNLAQQIYVSSKLWEVISAAKTSTIKLISAAKSEVADEATDEELLQVIMEKMQEVDLNPSEYAKRALRAEAEHLFNI